MDQEALVGEGLKIGRELVRGLRSLPEFDLKAAFWNAHEIDGQGTLEYSLVLVSGCAGRRPSRELLEDTNRALLQLNTTFVLSDLRVIILGPSDPRAAAILAFLGEGPARTDTWIRSRRIGDHYFERAYVYRPQDIAPLELVDPETLHKPEPAHP